MPEVKVIEPEATYLLWLDFRAWNMTPFELVHLFQDAGVKLNNGANYGKPGNGFIRLNVSIGVHEKGNSKTCKISHKINRSRR